MKRPQNLKLYKTELRAVMKERRLAISPEIKARNDASIALRLQGLPDYKKAGVILVYVSLSMEVDTLVIINNALAQGKAVAVPRCLPGTREMEFYLLKSLDELVRGPFGLLEPVPNPERLLTDFSKSFCVVPALCCDRYGYRLGYGGGYYDRFLNAYGGKKAVIIYEDFILRRLWHGRYDVPADFVVCERFSLRSLFSSLAASRNSKSPH